MNQRNVSHPEGHDLIFKVFSFLQQTRRETRKKVQICHLPCSIPLINSFTDPFREGRGHHVECKGMLRFNSLMFLFYNGLMTGVLKIQHPFCVLFRTKEKRSYLIKGHMFPVLILYLILPLSTYYMY